MACLRLESTGRMFFSTSSMGPGLWAIFSFRLSASRALFSFIWVACNDGSAPVSEGWETCIVSYVWLAYLVWPLSASGRVLIWMSWPSTWFKCVINKRKHSKVFPRGTVNKHLLYIYWLIFVFQHITSPLGAPDKTMSVCGVKIARTLQDVHPDQLRSLRATSDLMLQEILSLKQKWTKSKLSTFPGLLSSSVSLFSLSHKFSALFLNGVPYPGSFQAANLPMESCRALESCNT